MKVADILRVKGSTLFTVQPDEPLSRATQTMADKDIGSLVVMLLESHARYMPVVEHKVLMGVISFYDVAKAVVDSQNFENQMLKAYIRDWPSEDEAKPS